MENPKQIYASSNVESISPEIGVTISGMEGYETIGDGKTIRVRPKWQPIETAPEDRNVLIFCEHNIYIAYCTSEMKERGVFYIVETGDGISPTHWMPLPEKPDGL